MIRNGFLIALLLILISLSTIFSLKVEKIEYRHKGSRLGIGEEIDFHLFNLFFDNKVYLDDGNGKVAFSSFDFNWTNKGNDLPLCMGNSSNQCQNLPQGLLNIAGIFRLNCGTSMVYEFPRQGKIITYTKGLGGNSLDFLIPLFPSDDVVKSFSIGLRWVNESQLSIKENRLSFMVMNSFTKGGMKYHFGRRPSDLSQCKMEIANTTGLTGYKMIDNQGNELSGIESVSLTQEVVTPTCNPILVQKANDFISKITSNLTVSYNWFFLTDTLWYSGWFLLSDEMEECVMYLDNKLFYQNEMKTFNSSWCFEPSETDKWINDSCCNPLFFARGNKCCDSRLVSTLEKDYKTVTNTATVGCSSQKTTQELLNDYLLLKTTTNDPTYGCSSFLQQYANKKLLDDQYNSLFYCFQSLSVPSCYEDTDCPCSNCNHRLQICETCTIDNEQKYLLNCFQNSIPSSIESIARATWGITDVSKQQFLQTFYDKTLVQQCLGPNREFIDVNQTQCLSVGYCKYNTTEVFYPKTTKEQCNYTDFGICEVCDVDGSCTKLPLGDYCRANGPSNYTYDTCLFHGLTCNELLGECVYPNLNEQDCYCGTGNPSHPLCLNGYCSKGKNKSECIFDPEVDNAYKYWDEDLQDCVINIGARWLCWAQGYGDWIVGKKWIENDKSQLNITTKDECESLSVCSDDKVFKNGSCDSYNCYGYKYECINNIDNFNFSCYNSSITNSTECKMIGKKKF